jgi:predicted Zn-dependent protease
MHFEGRYYDGSSARAAQVRLTVERDWILRIEGEGILRELALAEVSISERLGSTPRVLRMPEGASVELPDSDALDQALRSIAVRGAPRFVFHLEQRWAAAIAAVVIAVAALFAGVRWGIPALADAAVERLPAGLDAELGEGALATLDEQLFEPSELDPQHRDRLTDRFTALEVIAQTQPPSRLLFRKGAAVGANAFSLPTAIIVTDQLVELAEQDDDVIAVLAHELGHVHHRHVMRSALRNVGIGVLVAGALGDFVSISALASTLPVLLVQLEYSRRFEREADAYSLTLLTSVGVDPGHLADMLERMSGMADEGIAYLSTHPATEERVAAIRRSL